jgi:hypothetical protein
MPTNLHTNKCTCSDNKCEKLNISLDSASVTFETCVQLHLYSALARERKKTYAIIMALLCLCLRSKCLLNVVTRGASSTQKCRGT